ncbi:epidermal retinol dehydrogenase 2-like isoform X2 [Neocloeon triangulifer]|uniref:epidermal retinol dehydrogenase 2-like isoform X2 n=1 Tax=Neocloeon triangulifer TaxID=2078957 RepID=UPI00286F6F53|nr:epidermal retinol dehydrogenase 2-like isoform X2 [Neocloeon triangulifer]
MFQGLVDFLVFLLLSAYYIIESIIINLIPRHYRAGWRQNLKGEIALVTGGGNGIGRILCTKLSRLGATVVIWDINSQGADDTAAMLRQEGGKAHSYKCDISNCEDVYATATKVRTEVGKVTILVNNAGIVTGKRLLDCPDSMIKKTFDVNILAHFWTTKAFLPDMIATDNGHIVTIASLAGLVGVNKLVDYSASKFAAVGFDESLRLELEVEGRRGVSTTVVCPYYISTGMFEGVKSRLFPILEPDYVADEIVTAIRSRDKVLLIPSYLRIFLALKFTLPLKMLYTLGIKVLHIAQTMDDFQGRQSAKSQLNGRHIDGKSD